MINRRAVIQAAMNAANDIEMGYDAECVPEILHDIDPDYDWAAELLQAEIEEGYRRMGPEPLRRPDPFSASLMWIYRNELERLVNAKSAFRRTLTL